MFFEQLQKLCIDNNTTLSAVTEYLGMSKGSISNWKRGILPNSDSVVRFAEHFGVSTDYLLLGATRLPKLTDDENELLETYRKLPQNKRYEYIGLLKGYLIATERDFHMESESRQKNA